MIAVRREFGTVIHARVYRWLARQHLENHLLTQAAAKFTCATGVGEQFALVHADRRN